jgi:hypothetical protein
MNLIADAPGGALPGFHRMVLADKGLAAWKATKHFSMGFGGWNGFD